MRRQKAALTRRLQSQYNAILAGDASAYQHWVPPGYNRPGQPPVQGYGYGYRNEWVAYVFAKQWGGRKGVDIKRLQLIALHSDNAECAISFARDIQGANVKRFQSIVLQHGSAGQMRRFAEIPGANRMWLENMAIVAEVMSM
jgi:hypothetical protein